MGHWRKQMISILITNKCNMACKYCYLGDKSSCDNQPKRVIDVNCAKRAIKDYFDGKHDWVLVQFKEKDTDFMPIPIVAEYRRHKKKWFVSADDTVSIDYYNDTCEPVAFMEIPHYKEATVGDKTARLELNKKELLHVQNDLIHNIYDIKKSVFGEEWWLGCVLSEAEKKLLTKEKEEQLRSYGYYSRLELKEKLDKFEEDNFMEDQCCGG